MAEARPILFQSPWSYWGTYVFLGGVAALFGYLMASDLFVGFGFIGGVLALATATVCMINQEAGMHICICYSLFIYHFARLLFGDNFTPGVGLEGLISITLLGMVIRRVPMKEQLFKLVGSRVGFCMTFFIVAYNFMEVANPFGQTMQGWLESIRKTVEMLFVLFLSFNVFKNFASVRRFILTMFVTCVIVAGYGCFQEWHGLLPFEHDWVFSNEARIALMYVGGDIRKFSTLPDPASFGMLMAAAGVFFMVLGFYQKRKRFQAILILGSILMLIAMPYSGTRTANAMVVGGALIFIILTLDKVKTRVFAVVATTVFLFLMYVPIYSNPTLIRFRTTFMGSKDESYHVRDVNRAAIQPYIYSHPFGGGLSTTGDAGMKYAPGNYLAGFPPDSGYLKMALEAGFIGLILTVYTYFAIMQVCVRGFFQASDYSKRWIYAAITAFFFSFFVAEYSQDAIGQIGNVMIYFPMLAVALKLNSLDLKPTTDK